MPPNTITPPAYGTQNVNAVSPDTPIDDSPIDPSIDAERKRVAALEHQALAHIVTKSTNLRGLALDYIFDEKIGITDVLAWTKESILDTLLAISPDNSAVRNAQSTLASLHKWVCKLYDVHNFPDPKDVLQFTYDITDFQHFLVRHHLKTELPGHPPPNMTNLDLQQWDRGVRRDKANYPKFTDEAQWDNFKRVFELQALNHVCSTTPQT